MSTARAPITQRRKKESENNLIDDRRNIFTMRDVAWKWKASSRSAMKVNGTNTSLNFAVGLFEKRKTPQPFSRRPRGPRWRDWRRDAASPSPQTCVVTPFYSFSRDRLDLPLCPSLSLALSTSPWCYYRYKAGVLFFYFSTTDFPRIGGKWVFQFRIAIFPRACLWSRCIQMRFTDELRAESCVQVLHKSRARSEEISPDLHSCSVAPSRCNKGLREIEHSARTFLMNRASVIV